MTNFNSNMITDKIFNCNKENFEQLAVDIFHYQYNHNDTYRQYCQAIHIEPGKITSLQKIPFLPIQFFKTREIKSDNFNPKAIFESSGTTGTIPSKHYVKDLALYEKSFNAAFEQFYGDVKDYCILGLLPSYLERKGSSLVYMVNQLIEKSGHSKSGFYLNEFSKMKETILENESNQQQTLLIGVSYALLDFAEQFPMQLKYTIIMETGGMKGRREEINKELMHSILKEKFELNEIHSEYGMTELMSQAYSKGNGIFNCPPWMKILLRAEDNPLETIENDFSEKKYQRGVVNIIDLVNIHSCSFIATDDNGKLYHDGSFEITGRMENSDVRGCGLMVM